jgi:ATP-dependent DNA helicase RecQ
MENILFFDFEISRNSKKIQDIGAIHHGEEFHKKSLSDFFRFSENSQYACGHNIFNHDLKFLHGNIGDHTFFKRQFIDTLYMSALLFADKPYHRLVKDYQILDEQHFANDPLHDSKLSNQLLQDEIQKFDELHKLLKRIYYGLLGGHKRFKGFFQLVGFNHPNNEIKQNISEFFAGQICSSTDLTPLIQENPIELAYALALINADNDESIPPPWLIKTFPEVNKVLQKLRFVGCKDTACKYCQEFLNSINGLRSVFGFDNFRSFPGEVGQPLQQQVVEAAINGESLLAIFPTGGGKSLSFQLPAIILGRAVRALTVIISPLQSLMKDQVDNLALKQQLNDAVTLNGLLSPVERKAAVERIEQGGANLLYISPESLRSPTIKRLLMQRSIARVVIDEAHCFSSWGQDFRVDYLYIGDFIQEIQKEKGLNYPIPISCFTATAKPQVIEDIQSYFQEKLNINFQVFQTNASRENLHYKAIACENEQDKFENLVQLIQTTDGPGIVFVSRTKKTEELSKKLNDLKFNSLPFHGQLDVKTKIAHQNKFMNGEVDIMIATSAFGMGVDKNDVELLVHYDISDSLENYVQESGRAGRDEKLKAFCYILYNENDINKHFTLFHQTKLNKKDIDQIWRSLKKYSQNSARIHKSALEIAKVAGWDVEMRDLETKVKSAILILENNQFVKRSTDSPRVFADSFLIRDIDKVNQLIDNSDDLEPDEKIHAKRIFQRLIKDDETRTDYLSDLLGIELKKTNKIIRLFRDKKILGDAKDLSAKIEAGKRHDRVIEKYKHYLDVERGILKLLKDQPKNIYLKEINSALIDSGIDSNIDQLQDIIRYWDVHGLLKKERVNRDSFRYKLTYRKGIEEISAEMRGIQELSGQILRYLLYKRDQQPKANDDVDRLIEFSLLELKENFQNDITIRSSNLKLSVYEKALLYLNSLDFFHLEKGVLILYNPMNIDRIELNNRIQFREKHFNQLKNFYKNKIEQIHIVGDYAKKLIKSYDEAINFTQDYFSLPYKDFIAKHYPNRKTEIEKPITSDKFRQIYGSLSLAQREIVKDEHSTRIMVIAGPGSGKTRVLVHKIASLLMGEDVKPDQFLMLTFSRSAAMEFRERLKALIGRTASFIDIFTYHSYCFHLLGQQGNLDKSSDIIPLALEAIQEQRINAYKIQNKSVLVIDEFQDIDAHEYALIEEIAKQAENLRIIAVGDEDQNVYEFRGASIQYLRSFIESGEAKRYEMLTNYRSKKNIVDFSDLFVRTIKDRLKTSPLQAHDKTTGVLEIVNCKSTSLISPIAYRLEQLKLNGSIAVLTSNNEQATKVHTLLNERNIPSRLVSKIDQIAVKDLIEIKSFTDKLISDCGPELGYIEQEQWDRTKLTINDKYWKSIQLELANKIILKFEEFYNTKFLSNWKLYIRETNIDDFIDPRENRVLVSTMHKAKGKEFDHVFVMMENQQIVTDEEKRLIYVAITRAKQRLYLYTNNHFFDQFKADGINIIHDNHHYEDPKTIDLYLGHRDVALGFFKRYGVAQKIKNQIFAGQTLYLIDAKDGLQTEQDKCIIKFSKSFISNLSAWFAKGYQFEKAQVKYKLNWYDQEEEKDYTIILPSIRIIKFPSV